jgi:thymidylate synthase
LPLPKLSLNPEISVITHFGMEDVNLEGYESHEAIKAPMAR